LVEVGQKVADRWIGNACFQKNEQENWPVAAHRAEAKMIRGMNMSGYGWLYADIITQECPQSCSNFLKVSDKAIPKSTLSQHFKILREAGLIRSERHGVELQNMSRCTELEQRFPGLIRAIVTAHSIQSADEARAKMVAVKRPAKRAAAK
jgi:DNA-binding transcriptional ArsR family regulator